LPRDAGTHKGPQPRGAGLAPPEEPKNRHALSTQLSPSVPDFGAGSLPGADTTVTPAALDYNIGGTRTRAPVPPIKASHSTTSADPEAALCSAQLRNRSRQEWSIYTRRIDCRCTSVPAGMPSRMAESFGSAKNVARP